MSKSTKPTGGGGARNPNSLANLRPGAGAGDGGMQRNLGHGGYAQIARERLDAKAAEIFQVLASDAPLRDGDGGLPRHDSAQVALLADCLCRIDTLRADINAHGVLHARGKRKGAVRPAVELESKLRREAAGYLAELGMTPKARAALGVDLSRAASTMADEIAAAQLAREARERGPTVIDATASEDA